MNLYIVNGRASSDGYHELLTVLENMEEKPKSYVGNSRRIEKHRINELSEGIFKGSYEIILLDDSMIYEARRKIKDRVYQDKLFDLEKLRATVHHMETHSIDTEIKKGK